MISIKRYMDANAQVLVDEPEPDPLAGEILGCYRSALLAVGKRAAEACATPGGELELQLTKLLGRLPDQPTSDALKRTEVDVEERLNRWASDTADYLKKQTNGVKELLMMLARTAESVGERDQRYAGQLCDLTVELNAIANLDDLTLVRSSVARKAKEMKSCVDRMTQESQHSISELKSRVVGYETKLKTVEQLALKDSLTGIANRRCAEGRMEWYVGQKQTYCVLIVDLDGFKAINDKHGHAAGDDVLKQFAGELVSVMRATDLVARWGGDEFIVVLNCEPAEASPQIERIRQWAMGDYMIQPGGSKSGVKVRVGGSVGVAHWLPGKTVQQVIEQADTAMYLDKKQARKKRA